MTTTTGLQERQVLAALYASDHSDHCMCDDGCRELALAEAYQAGWVAALVGGRQPISDLPHTEESREA